jgi:anti-sigma factor RsiW
MKPCFRKRKSIAWLALGNLDASRATELRAHLEACAGCRRYYEEMSAVGRRLAAAEAQPGVEATELFHRALLKKLRAEPPRAVGNTLAAWLEEHLLNWRVALPALGVAALVIMVLAVLPRHQRANPSTYASHPFATASAPARDLLPTVANYQRAASRSLDDLDDLDDLLTAQARRKLPQAAPYTASMFALAGASE